VNNILVLVFGCVHIYPADAYIELVASDVYENLFVECSVFHSPGQIAMHSHSSVNLLIRSVRIFFMMLLVTK
jgi:hypothetical protein